MLTKKVKIFEMLKSDKDFDAVYKKGRVTISADRKIKANYISYESTANRARIALTVSSKAGNSVWRNRLKRIMRESLRQENETLKEIVFKNKLVLSIIFSPYRINQINNQHLFLKDIKPAITNILNKLKTISRN